MNQKNANGAMVAEESAVIGGYTVAQWFVSFWNGYPRQEGKKAARVAFMKAAAVASMDDIKAGLRRYKANLPADPRFILSPARWLREERWTDEPPKHAPRVVRSNTYLQRTDGLTREQVQELGL